MFKNAMIYKITQQPEDVAAMEAALQAQVFAECGPTQERAAGWVPPRGEAHGPLVEVVDGQMLLRLMVESKAVPSAVVKRKAEERAREIEATTGRKPGKREQRDLRDEAKLSLMPLAFTKRSTLTVWIDPKALRLVVDTSSQSRADEVISLLVKTLEGFGVRELHTATSPMAAMSHWLASQEPPPGFSIDRECELKAVDSSKAAVRYGHHALDIEEIRQHIAEGKLPTRLAMTWDDRVSFVLTDGLQLRKLTLQDGALVSKADDTDGFEADMAIMTGEMRRLLPDLLVALGGEVELGASD